MRHAAARLALRYGLSALLGLALLGRFDAIVVMPPEFAALGMAAQNGARLAVVVGAAVLVALAISAGIALRGGRSIGAIWPAALLSLSAGVSEELFFRLFLPLVIGLATGGFAAGFVVSLLVFVAMHRHQDLRGMAGVALAGVALTLVYLMSGRLWAAMLLHIVIDLNALVLRGRSVRPSAASQCGKSR